MNKKDHCKFFYCINYLLSKKQRKTIKSSKKYYENNNERLLDQAKNKYRQSSDKEKDVKKEYGRNRYQNISEENEQRLKEYQKKIIVKQKNQHKISFFLYMVQKWNKKL